MRRPCCPDLPRWWFYQRERFPVVAHGLLIAAFSGSAVSFSALLRGGSPLPGAASYLTAFVTSFLLFLQLRIADEHKDYEEDKAYRPYRPVQRGLVTLRELAVVGLAAAVIQMALALWHAEGLVWLLFATWGYLALMTKEFFVREWLVARPLTYLWTHMLIIPLADLYATACDWLRAGSSAPEGLAWFIAASFTNGVALEIGRKIRAPEGEEHGVRTYSALRGRRARRHGRLRPARRAPHRVSRAGRRGAGGLFLAGAWLVRSFLAQPATVRARRLDHFSALWTMALYLMLGIVPLVLRTFLEAR